MPVKFIKKILLFTLVTAISLKAPAAEEISHIPDSGTIIDSILEIKVVHQSFSHLNPWKRATYRSQTVPGFFLAPGLVLAGNLEIEAAATILLKNPADGRQIPLTIKAYDEQLKIALLEVQSKQTFPEMQNRLKILDNPELMLRLKQISSYGFNPDNGKVYENNLFIKGVKSFYQPATLSNLPALYFTAWEQDISPGDLIISENLLIGVVHSYDRKQHKGYAIPSVFVAQFLTGVFQQQKEAKQPQEFALQEDSSDLKSLEDREIYSRVPHPGFTYSTELSAVQKNYFGIKRKQSGLLVRDVMVYSDAYEKLLRDDLIIGINGKKIRENGTLLDPIYGDLPAGAALILNQGRLVPKNSVVKLKVLRRGELREISINLKPFFKENLRVPRRFERPDYLILQGLVFLDVSGEYINRKPNVKSKLKYLNDYRKIRNLPGLNKYVVLDRIVPLKVNQGYNTSGLLLKTVNGVAVQSVRHLYYLVEEALLKKFMITMVFDGNRKVVLDPAESRSAAEELRRNHGIQFMDNISSE